MYYIVPSYRFVVNHPRQIQCLSNVTGHWRYYWPYGLVPVTFFFRTSKKILSNEILKKVMTIFMMASISQNQMSHPVSQTSVWPVGRCSPLLCEGRHLYHYQDGLCRRAEDGWCCPHLSDVRAQLLSRPCQTTPVLTAPPPPEKECI